MGENKTLCLVDDEDVFHWIVRGNLKRIKFPFNFISFYEGDEVLEYLSDTSNVLPDIILLDLNMPICDGWKFLDGFSTFDESIKKSITIYILSSSIDPNDEKRALKYPNVKSFVLKPITIDFLEKILN
jgi:CheY-like chemotaxis protein